MDTPIKNKALQLFLILSGIFIASLVVGNLILNKFFCYYHIESWDYCLVVSVGILPYPITFLVTDLISELFGRKRANQVVVSGFVVSVFVLLVLKLALVVPAIEGSPVNDDQFARVFGNSGAAIISSMSAYLLAQFIDVRIFHWWKRRTGGKKLWLRNNLSTIPSQLIDTAVVYFVLCAAGEIAWSNFWPYLLAGFIFKVIIALIDTPILYVLVLWARRHFNLKAGEEITF